MTSNCRFTGHHGMAYDIVSTVKWTQQRVPWQTKRQIGVQQPQPGYFFPFDFSSRTAATTRSSSSRLYTAIVCEFVRILPPYDSRSFDAPTILPVCCNIRSRSVDTSRSSGRSEIVMTEPSNFHSGLDGSFGSCMRSEIGCYKRVESGGGGDNVQPSRRCYKEKTAI